MRINYTLDLEILKQTSAIAERLGEVKALFLNQMDPLFRQKNRIDSIQATLSLEGKRLSREKAAAIVKHRAVREPKKLIQEVYNTNRVYEMLPEFDPLSQDSFQKAHHEMLAGSDTPKGYRTEEIAIFHRHGTISMAPFSTEVKPTMNELFHYLRHGKDPVLIKSCILHYYIVFIHPFENGSERMSWLWQTLLLMKEHPVYEFLPYNKEILDTRKKYYQTLPGAEQKTDATDFIHYMLQAIDNAFIDFLKNARKLVRPHNRIEHFHTFNLQSFTRKDYMCVFKSISTATATRDLELGVETGLFEKRGSNNQTTYSCQLL